MLLFIYPHLLYAIPI